MDKPENIPPFGNNFEKQIGESISKNISGIGEFISSKIPNNIGFSGSIPHNVNLMSGSGLTVDYFFHESVNKKMQEEFHKTIEGLTKSQAMDVARITPGVYTHLGVNETVSHSHTSMFGMSPEEQQSFTSHIPHTIENREKIYERESAAAMNMASNWKGLPGAKKVANEFRDGKLHTSIPIPEGTKWTVDSLHKFMNSENDPLSQFSTKLKEAQKPLTDFNKGVSNVSKGLAVGAGFNQVIKVVGDFEKYFVTMAESGMLRGKGQFGKAEETRVNAGPEAWQLVKNIPLVSNIFAPLVDAWKLGQQGQIDTARRAEESRDSAFNTAKEGITTVNKLKIQTNPGLTEEQKEAKITMEDMYPNYDQKVISHYAELINAKRKMVPFENKIREAAKDMLPEYRKNAAKVAIGGFENNEQYNILKKQIGDLESNTPLIENERKQRNEITELIGKKMLLQRYGNAHVAQFMTGGGSAIEAPYKGISIPRLERPKIEAEDMGSIGSEEFNKLPYGGMGSPLNSDRKGINPLNPPVPTPSPMPEDGIDIQMKTPAAWNDWGYKSQMPNLKMENFNEKDKRGGINGRDYYPLPDLNGLKPYEQKRPFNVEDYILSSSTKTASQQTEQDVLGRSAEDILASIDRQLNTIAYNTQRVA